MNRVEEEPKTKPVLSKPDQHDRSTLGKFHKPLPVLYSGCDEYVPESVDKELLMKRFEDATTPGRCYPLSKLVDGGRHVLSEGSKKGATDDTVSTRYQIY